MVIMGMEEGEEDLVKKKLDELMSMLMEGSGTCEYEVMERIGRKGERARPLRIVVENAEDRKRVMKNASNLKDDKDFERVYIMPHMPRQQQAEDKQLRDKLKTFKQQGALNVKIFRREIVQFEGRRKTVLFSVSNTSSASN